MHRRSRVVVIALVLSLLCGLLVIPQSAGATNDHAQAVRSTSASTAIAQPMAASDTVYITKTGSCYHRATCSCLRKSKIQTTRGEAEKQGLRPCKRCNP